MAAVLVAACTSRGPSNAPAGSTTGSAPAVSTGPAANASTGAGTAWSIVALGDSVPAGSACHCTPYPQLSASGLSVPGVRTVTAANEAVGGYTTTDVLKQLTDDKAVIGQFSSADAVEVEIGANDVPYNSRCGTDLACYTPSVPPVEQNLDAIVKRVRELLAGRPAVVVLLDYWSVWLGGKYAQQKGPDYVAAAEAVTHEVDTAIRAVATRTGSFYVDLRAAFKGPSYSYDESHYLASDGDHPNAEGHKQIAAAVVTVVESGLHLPPS